MKLVSSVLLTCALVLCSCSTAGKATVSNPADPTAGKGVEQEDTLIYLLWDDRSRGQLISYDPLTQTHTSLLPDWEIDGFSVSAQGRLAFSTGPDEQKDLFILDSPFAQNAPAKLTQNTVPEIRLFPWSPDGRYLAYEATQADGKTLLVWDGTAATSLYRSSGSVGGLAWSADGRLAIDDYDGEQYEIFIWDGTTIASASQNPSGDDLYPVWSADGQFAFLSCWDQACDIYVWDGQLTKNGAPDIKTFTNVAPALTDYYSQPVWTSSGSLSFIAFEPDDVHAAQIFEWDGQTAANISQNPGFHNGGQRWSGEGAWAFVTFFSSARRLYVRDAENQPVLTTEGEYAPAWSPRGRLMFCRYERPEWVLSLWDGKSVTEVARGDEIRAQWNNGAEVHCWSG